ncbi:MAG: hypothetical protein PUB94_06015, partial [Oscillospiraceae bacterium]|nr:hypothetical protein [Oscillospiraceae bacterium]
NLLPSTIDLNTLLYQTGDFFGITFNAHPHSGWLFVLLSEQNCLKTLIEARQARLPRRFICVPVYKLPALMTDVKQLVCHV